MEHSLPILIVEDDPVLSEITKRMLQLTGHDVSCVPNGVRALEMLSEKFYPIVITDWQMPQMDGLELCRRLRKGKFPGYIYIIVLTSRNSHGDILAGLEAGADQYLIKPVNRKELLARLNAAKRIVERRKHPRFLIDLPAEYWPANISKGCPGRTGDISEGGVLLYLPEKIAVGQNIGVKILIGTGFESKSIEAIGEPVWNDSHFGEKDSYYRIGVKFVDIAAENMDELKTFLNAQMNLETPSELNIRSGFLSTGISVMNREDGQPIVDEPSQEEKRKPLHQREKETFSSAADGKEEDGTKLPPELLNDFREDYGDEQRQNLYRKILDMSILERQRLAILGNREVRSLLIRDPNKMIFLNVLKNAKINESEVLQYVQRRDLAQDIILAIAQEQKWRKNYSTKFALVCNPKTPLSVSITFVSHLHERALKLLSKDKNVSSVLSRKADEILHTRDSRSMSA